MKSDKIEILLEALTEDLAELKKSSSGEGQEGIKDDIQILANLNAQLSTKIDELISLEKKAHGATFEHLSSIRADVKGVQNQRSSSGVFEDESIIFEATRKDTATDYLKQILWPLPRLAWTVLLCLLLSGGILTYGYIVYFQPLSEKTRELKYKDVWMSRAYPDQYNKAMSFYNEHMEAINAQTDSLSMIEQNSRQQKINEKLQELKELQGD